MSKYHDDPDENLKPKEVKVVGKESMFANSSPKKQKAKFEEKAKELNDQIKEDEAAFLKAAIDYSNLFNSKEIADIDNIIQKEKETSIIKALTKIADRQNNDDSLSCCIGSINLFTILMRLTFSLKKDRNLLLYRSSELEKDIKKLKESISKLENDYLTLLVKINNIKD